MLLLRQLKTLILFEDEVIVEDKDLTIMDFSIVEDNIAEEKFQFKVISKPCEWDQV